jgi:uncharacterized Zn-binding protein involved in type VI secretion
MKRIIATVPLVLSLAMAATAAELPAARVGDSMQSGGVIASPGATTVVIGGAAAARVGDFATDPRLDGFIPCIGGQIVTGSASVIIGGKPAARVGDLTAPSRATCGADVIVGGSATVRIGN